MKPSDDDTQWVSDDDLLTRVLKTNPEMTFLPGNLLQFKYSQFMYDEPGDRFTNEKVLMHGDSALVISSAKTNRSNPKGSYIVRTWLLVLTSKTLGWIQNPLNNIDQLDVIV